MKSPLVSEFNVGGRPRRLKAAWICSTCGTAGSRALSKPPALLDDFQRVALVRPVSGGTQQGAQGAGGASLASNDFAYIAFGDFQFDYVIVEFLDEDFFGRVDERFRNQLNESAHISRGLSHKRLILAVQF
jgi:hypothetical protein